MAAALGGIAWLQASWILRAMSLNAERFDKSVFEALRTVATQLEREEYWFVLQDKRIEAGDSLGTSGIVPEMAFQKSTAFRENMRNWEILQIDRITNPKTIEERIGAERLSQLLKQEMTNQGINASYQYGVFSNDKRAFVVANGRYMVVQDSTGTGQSAMYPIYKSNYRVHLFQTDIRSPGLLMVYFPGKASVLFRNLWTTLALTVLFTSIILFCFVYTVRVIFQQKKLSEMKNDFINNMTHEFKTPIATISLATDSIISPMILQNPDKIKRFADIIKQENRRMNSQVEKVLQMAMLDKQDFQLNITDVDVHDLILTAVGNFNIQIEKRDGTIQLDLDAQETIIEADITHLTSVVHNLLDNANKYSPEKPEISITTKNIGMGIEIVVKDKGMGMNRDVVKYIFEKFYRVHTGNVHDVKGFGLGLSYVKAIVAAHKGHIEVESEPDKGSSFRLFFPHKWAVD